MNGTFRPADSSSLRAIVRNLSRTQADAAFALHVAHYNFCRVHRTLKTTPAVAAGVAGDVWTLEELYDKAMGS